MLQPMQRTNAFPTDHGQPLMLTTEQQAIVHSQAASAIIAALAGTGKTTTLACCAVQALRAQPDARILVLAHSRAGVQAFQHRLRALVHQVPGHLQVTTLERWSARTLRQRDAGVRFVADPVELRQQAQQALLELEAQLQRQPDERISMPAEVDMQAFWTFNRAAKKSLLLQRVQDAGGDLAAFCEEHLLDYTLARIFCAYERLRLDTCGDVRYYAEGDCTYALAQEEGDPLPAPYDLVLFDEMHDLDLAALTVLRRLLHDPATRFLGAGDFNQHIDTQAWSVFRNQLHQLADFLPQTTATLPLTQSRRFGPAVAQAVNRWFPVGMQASTKRYSTVYEWSYQDDADCIRQLLQAQASLSARDGATPPPLTVILRHPHEAAALEWAVAATGQVASLHGLPHFYEERELALLLGLMYAHGLQVPDWKSSPCPLGPQILERFIDGALYFGKGRVDTRQEDSDLPTMAAQMHQHPQGIWRFLIGEHTAQGGRRNFAAFGNFLHLPLALQDNAQALLQQADVWGLFAATPMPHTEAQRLRTRVQGFIDLVAGLSVPQVLQQIASMVQRRQRLQHTGQPPHFQILSIEQAKGQEFEAVAIPFLAPGRFPAPVPHALAFVERNRLYVAMTRARQRLWLLEDARHPIQAFEA